MTTGSSNNSDWMDSWNVPTQGKFGHHEKLTFRLSPEMAKDIQELAESKTFPYRGASQLIRHAVFLHLQRLHAADGTLDRWKAVEGMLYVLSAEEEFATFDSMMERTAKLVARHLESGRITDASRVVRSLLAQIARMPEGETREEHVRFIYERWSFLVKGTVTVELEADREPVSVGISTVVRTRVNGPASLNPDDASDPED